MSREQRLQLWATGNAPETELIPRPLPGDVLYVAPNPDKTRKMCENCFMWQSARQTCMIHDPGVIVVADMVCGYHVFGKPQTNGCVLQDAQFVEPETSGLEQVPGGTSCDNCKNYRRHATTQGSCVAVADPEDPNADAMVEALGCCTRWRAADG